VLRRAKELQRDLKVQSLTGHVVTDRNGKPKTAAACRDAWRDALVRAKLEGKDYTVKDIRAKALTDAKKAGYDIEALQVAGAHTDRATTEGYASSARYRFRLLTSGCRPRNSLAYNSGNPAHLPYSRPWTL